MIAAALLAASTLAWPDGVVIPPAQYDHPPKMPIVVIHPHAAEFAALCPHDSSCSIEYVNGNCVIAMPEWSEVRTSWSGRGKPQRPTPEYIGHLFRHERAHCNGWRHTP